jgi:hypothetical protein
LHSGHRFILFLPVATWQAIRALLFHCGPTHIAWFIVTEWVNAVKRCAFWSYADAINELLHGVEFEFDFGITGMVICAHLAALLCLVVAGACPSEHWIVLHASALARMVAPIEPQPVMARLADQGLALIQHSCNDVRPNHPFFSAVWTLHFMFDISIWHTLLLWCIVLPFGIIST